MATRRGGVGCGGPSGRRCGCRSCGWRPICCGGGLGADPVTTALLRTGRYALVSLLLSLVPTAVARLTGSRALMATRRTLGLSAFGYALLHFLIYVGADYGFDLGLVLRSVADSLYVLAGAAALLILIPLAVTSTDGWVRRLGRRWRGLHRLAYLAAALAVLHFGWTFKELRLLPLVAGGLVVGLVDRAFAGDRPVTRGRRRRRHDTGTRGVGEWQRWRNGRCFWRGDVAPEEEELAPLMAEAFAAGGDTRAELFVESGAVPGGFSVGDVQTVIPLVFQSVAAPPRRC